MLAYTPAGFVREKMIAIVAGAVFFGFFVFCIGYILYDAVKDSVNGN